LNKRSINIFYNPSFNAIIGFMIMCSLLCKICFEACQGAYQTHNHQIMIELIYHEALTCCLLHFSQLNLMIFVICIIRSLLICSKIWFYKLPLEYMGLLSAFYSFCASLHLLTMGVLLVIISHLNLNGLMGFELKAIKYFINYFINEISSLNSPSFW
jgi:hypothetical protein